jgi:hypothetical protein
MKTFITAMVLVLAGGCYHSKVDADRSTLAKVGGQELACGTAKPAVVFYGLRGADNAAVSPCFGDKAEALGVVECGGKRKAYWKTAGQWAVRPGEVTSADEHNVEISLAGTENASGSVEAVARCSR